MFLNTNCLLASHPVLKKYVNDDKVLLTRVIKDYKDVVRRMNELEQVIKQMDNHMNDLNFDIIKLEYNVDEVNTMIKQLERRIKRNNFKRVGHSLLAYKKTLLKRQHIRKLMQLKYRINHMSCMIKTNKFEKTSCFEFQTNYAVWHSKLRCQKRELYEGITFMETRRPEMIYRESN